MQPRMWYLMSMSRDACPGNIEMLKLEMLPYMFDIERSRALTETVEIYKRLEEDHSNKKLVENW